MMSSRAQTVNRLASARTVLSGILMWGLPMLAAAAHAQAPADSADAAGPSGRSGAPTLIAAATTSAPMTVALAAPSVPAGPVFKSSVKLVVLGVTVTDGRERPVPNLLRTNFAVMESGRQQEIAFFASDPTPLDLVILLDTSSSMNGSIAAVQAAALELAHALRPGDRAAFAEVKRGMRVLQALSPDISGLERAIRSTRPGGQTSLFQSIYIALADLKRAATPGEIRRQALVVLSDGEDTTSLIGFDDMLDAAKRSGVAIYCVSLKTGMTIARQAVSLQVPAKYSVAGDYALRSLADSTGGRAFFRFDPRDLGRICHDIANELANQYAIGYVSNDPREDGAFRPVAVRVLDNATARARTRPGYFAAPSPRGP